MKRILLPIGLTALAALAAVLHLQRVADASPAALEALALATPPAEPGTFPAQWIHGADPVNDPAFQVHWYSENVAILRQSKFETFESPFLYLIFGDDKILLMDTGANPTSPVGAAVGQTIQRWRDRTGNTTAKLVVAHTHGHFDHIQGDAQFAAYPQLELPVGGDLVGPDQFRQFWGFQNYPHDQPTIDLGGGRVLDVIGVPGHHPNSVALYDRETQLLLTGDIVYPGHLFVFSPAEWTDFVQSIRRLTVFASQNPVTWVVGCHVETSTTPFRPFAYGTSFQPNEHPLQFPPSILAEVLQACKEQGATPACTIYESFVIHPVYLCGITWNG